VATVQPDHRDLARRAIEEVCARGDFAKAPQFYSERFHDHVNSLEYHGLDGVRKSVELYLSIFPDLEIEVEEQVADGDRVASRWVARGTNRGRRVEMRGITISRFEEGRIVEDWGYADTLDMLRQLGPLRVVALGADQLIGRLRRSK
jgi:predicted ester cyclase